MKIYNERMTEAGSFYRDVLIALLGAMVLVVIKFLIYLRNLIISRFRPIAKYYCFTASEEPGIMQHKCGHRGNAEDTDEGKAWILDSNDIPHPTVLYGPYVNDFGRPGDYQVAFRIKGENFEGDNAEILRIEVAEVKEIYDEEIGKTVNYTQIPIGQTTIRRRDIKSGKWRNYCVNCYSSGAGKYEYRAYIYKGNFNPSIHRLSFEKIVVRRKVPPFTIL